MDSLTELYNQAILPMDEELEKQASELYKQAEEEDAAGRIMARGFADELNKLAQPNFGENVGLKPRQAPKAPAVGPQDKKVTVGGGKTLNPVTGNQAVPKPPPIKADMGLPKR